MNLQLNKIAKILIGIFVIGTILIGGWWVWQNRTEQQRIEFLKSKCCVECKEAFAHNPIGVGAEVVDCTHFVEGGTATEFFLSKECAEYFQANPTKVAECIKEQVTVTTDKTEYRKGEIIKITIRNGLNESIFSHAASGTPVFAIDYLEKKMASGSWETLSVREKGVMWDIDVAREIKPSQSVTFEWEPWIYKEDNDKPIQAGKGVYRLLITYQIRRGSLSENWEWLKIYSNEFTIK